MVGGADGTRRRARVVLDDPGYGVVDRAYVQELAADLGLAGFVRARRGPAGTDGLWAEVEGAPAGVAEFVEIVRHGAGGAVTVEDVPPLGGAEFAVVVGAGGLPAGAGALVPDAGLCGPCRIELSDRADRRFRHPFAGCLRCGPSYTLRLGPAGGRDATTMAPFDMCRACRAEQADPRSRRYGAAAVCCPACGPRAAVLTPTGAVLAGELVRTAVRVLMEDQILAVKEAGGWQLWADAASVHGVAALRERLKETAPFAALCADLDMVREHFVVGPGAAEVLGSRRRPRVLLGPAPAARLAPALAAGSAEVAVGLPSTGLGHLLAEALRRPIAVADAPDADPHHAGGGNEEARRRLGGIADAFLAHERAIAAPAAESVVRVVAGREFVVRRGRGHAPEPLALPWVALRTVLALGTDAGATPCLVQGRRAVLLPEPACPPGGRAGETVRAAAERLRLLTGSEPDVVAHDPERSAASAYAQELAGALGVPAVAVPRPHAHVAACLADNGVREAAIGVVLGPGLGEVLVGGLAGLEATGEFAMDADAAELADAVAAAVAAVRRESGIATVALSGGLLTAGPLLGLLLADLTRRQFRVLAPVRVSPGEGGLAFGQAVLAAARG